jgi:hypothetical protein
VERLDLSGACGPCDLAGGAGGEMGSLPRLHLVGRCEAGLDEEGVGVFGQCLDRGAVAAVSATSVT